MACNYRCGILVMCLFIGSLSFLASSKDDDYFHCKSVVRNWADYSKESGTKKDDLTLKDLLFFLHVPRTGGRTYFYCFLGKLYTSDQECPRSYDKLRFDPSKPNCRLVVTHDDYSLMSKLPKDRTSVVTILRDPVERVFSIYEFSIEVAARFLVHPNLTSAVRMSGKLRQKTDGVSTLDIWPWKYLVPWMRQDLFIRRDARNHRRPQKAEEMSNPYDMEGMAMPLHKYINDPIVHEIIHNGATFQVAGLTNNSYTSEAHGVRACVRRHPELGRFVLEVAKHRLNHMLYVGLTDEHKMSAAMFVKLVGAQVLSQSEAFNSDAQQPTSKKTKPSYSFPNPEANHFEDGTNHAKDGEGPSPASANLTVGKLMETYERCSSRLRKSQASRRTLSLKNIAPVNFSKHARLSVPKSILQQIRNLNNLDVELYRHAQSIFKQQEKHLSQNAEDVPLQHVGDRMTEMRDARNHGRPQKSEEMRNPYDMEGMAIPLQKYINDPIAHEIIHNGATFQGVQEGAECGNSVYGCWLLKLFLAIPLIMLTVVFTMFVRRRTKNAKIKP